MKSKKNPTYVKKNFFMIKMEKKKFENIPNISTKNTGKFRGAADSI